MKQTLVLLLYLILSVLTYGASYSNNQKFLGGYFSHQKNTEHHVRSAIYSVFPPFWVSVFIFTGGWSDGLQFVHNHKRFCEAGEFGGCEKK